MIFGACRACLQSGTPGTCRTIFSLVSICCDNGCCFIIGQLWRGARLVFAKLRSGVCCLSGTYQQIFATAAPKLFADSFSLFAISSCSAWFTSLAADKVCGTARSSRGQEGKKDWASFNSADKAQTGFLQQKKETVKGGKTLLLPNVFLKGNV